ncbi:hypothetical protein ANTQUA_LOCUS6564 [Anthophora quadrimaculata]
MCTFRRRRKIYVLSDSSDSASEPILYKQIEPRYKNVQKDAEITHNGDSNVENHKTVPQKPYTDRLITSDSSHTEISKRNKRKRYRNRNNESTNSNLNDTSDSSLSCTQTRKFLKINEKRSKSDKIEIIACNQETDYEYAENYTSDSNLFVASTSKKQNTQNTQTTQDTQSKQNTQNTLDTQDTQSKQNTQNTLDTQDTQDTQQSKENEEGGQNFKPAMIKIGEKLKKKFSIYEQFINRLQSKYIKDDTLTTQDAIDMLFIFNCIISKLKEELSNLQQDLANYCIQWKTQDECNHTVSQEQNKQYVNGNNLQVERGTNSQINSNSSGIQSGNILEKYHTDTADRSKIISKINVHKKNESRDKLSLKTNNNSPRILEYGSGNVRFQRNEQLTKNKIVLADIHTFKVPEKRPVVYSKNMKNSTPISKLSNQDFTEMLELSSEYESDSSDDELVITQQLPHYSSNDKRKNGLNQSKSPTLEISKEQLSESLTQASYNSDETVIIPRKNMLAEDERQNYTNRAAQRYTVYSNNENLISPQGSGLVISSVNSLNTKHQFESNCNSKDFISNVNPNNKSITNIVDKKLKMNCKVLIPRCKYN